MLYSISFRDRARYISLESAKQFIDLFIKGLVYSTACLIREQVEPRLGNVYYSKGQDYEQYVFTVSLCKILKAFNVQGN